MFRELSFDELKEVYDWVDTFSLSRPKKNIWRDFSDGFLVAEIVAQKHPHLVNVNSIVSTHRPKQKQINWELLEEKTLKKLGMKLPTQLVEGIINAKLHAIESFLYALRERLEEPIAKPQIVIPRDTTLTKPKRAGPQETLPIRNKSAVKAKPAERLLEKREEPKSAKVSSKPGDSEQKQLVEALREELRLKDLKIQELERNLEDKEFVIKELEARLSEQELVE